jgi:hypothetical protein
MPKYWFLQQAVLVILAVDIYAISIILLMHFHVARD